MAVTTQDKRDEKLEWLMRPINWAYNVAAFIGGLSLLIWLNGDASAAELAYVAVPALIVTAGLLLWSVKRIIYAANRT